MTEEHPLITVGEAADILQTGKSKIRKLIKDGTLTVHANKLDKRYHLVERKQVEELAQEGRGFRHLQLDMG